MYKKLLLEDQKDHERISFSGDLVELLNKICDWNVWFLKIEDGGPIFKFRNFRCDGKNHRKLIKEKYNLIHFGILWKISSFLYFLTKKKY